jgi:replication fork clamp-binding protein CrfC
MERLTLKEISKQEFDKQATPLFQVFDQATRKRLKRIVRDDMVLPVLGHADQEWRAFNKENGAAPQDA